MRCTLRVFTAKGCFNTSRRVLSEKRFRFHCLDGSTCKQVEPLCCLALAPLTPLTLILYRLSLSLTPQAMLVRRGARLSLNGGRHTDALVVRPPVSSPPREAGLKGAVFRHPQKTQLVSFLLVRAFGVRRVGVRDELIVLSGVS
jgi:hypothetical protein